MRGAKPAPNQTLKKASGAQVTQRKKKKRECKCTCCCSMCNAIQPQCPSTNDTTTWAKYATFKCDTHTTKKKDNIRAELVTWGLAETTDQTDYTWTLINEEINAMTPEILIMQTSACIENVASLLHVEATKNSSFLCVFFQLHWTHPTLECCDFRRKRSKEARLAPHHMHQHANVAFRKLIFWSWAAEQR